MSVCFAGEAGADFESAFCGVCLDCGVTDCVCRGVWCGWLYERGVGVLRTDAFLWREWLRPRAALVAPRPPPLPLPLPLPRPSAELG